MLEAARDQGVPFATQPLPLLPDPHPPGAFAYPGKIAGSPGRLFEIRELAPATGRVRTWRAVPGTTARTRSSSRGLCVVDGRLYVADTNHHRIVAVDLACGSVRTVAPTTS